MKYFDMAPCRFLVFFVVVVCAISIGSADKKTACGEVKSSAKRSIISNGNLNVDISALQKGLKRSVSEDEDDCNDSKKDKVEIKESAASAIPGHNADSNENEKKSNVKGSLNYLVLPNQDSENDNTPTRKDKLEKPARKHSPLWSLSKLIATVDSKGSKKNNVSLVKESAKTKSAIKTEKGVTKTNLALATDPSKAIKATLSKAIEKVEKVIATKNAKMITPMKADVKSKEPEKKPSNSSNSTVSAAKGKAVNATSSNGKKTEKAVVKAIQDPYAQIAMGPDRPKIPELKSDAGDDGPIMKMNNGQMKSVPGSESLKNSAPLGGQHDVGGLLDRLTDKLNSGGGGVAMDSPLTGTNDANDVKYVQTPMDDEAGQKQAQAFAMDKLKDQADLSEVKTMTEQEGLLAGNGGDNADPAAAAAAAAAAATAPETNTEAATAPETNTEAATARETNTESSPESDAQMLEKAVSSSATDASALANALSSDSTAASSQDISSLTGGASDANTDDAIAKSLSKAGQLSTEAVMNMLKGAKIPAADFSNAEVSPGPDPYEGSEGGQNAADTDALGSLFSSKSSSNADSASDLDTASDLNGGGLGSFSDAGSLGGSDGLSSRSTESESDDDYERNTIPLAIDMNSDSFRNRYNTEVFKKHVIMRPKRDTYVSPFNSKEAFDTAI